MQDIKFPKFKNYNGQKIRYIQPKLDGHLCKVIKLNSHLWQAYTKNHKIITDKLIGISHIEKEIAGLPCNSTIFGELHCPGIHATSVPTMWNDADEKLQFTVFAAPFLDGMNHIDNNLVNVMFILKDLGFSVAHTKLWPNDDIGENYKACLLEDAKQKKLEGWVLKEAHMAGWYKLKPTKTLDAFVICTHQSFSSTHYGGLQAISIGVYDKGKIIDLGHVGSGFNLPYRQQLDTKEKRNELLDRVCVIEYDCVAAKGKLRFPRMAKDDDDNIIWRTDKDPKQCTIDQLEN